MKNKIKIVIPVLAAMLMSACVKDQGDPVEPGKGHGNKITFSIPGKSGGSQRAVDSNGNEDKIDSLAIFMFDATSKKLNNTFTSSDIQYADIPTGGMTATIEVTENVGSKVFFFVANPALAADLDNIRFNVTEIDEFQETISDSLPGLPGDQGASLLMSCKTTVADVERVTAAERKIGIRRRVARFDIDNMAVDPNDPSNANGTNFTIKKILLENINKQGYVFGDATGNAGIPLKKSNIEVPFGDGPGHNEGRTESAFFTYPCTIEAGKAGISFEGEFNGETRTYSLVPSAGKLEIEPNMRYTLKAQRLSVDSVTFAITVEDWEDHGSELPAESEKEKLEVTGVRIFEGDGVFADNGRTYEIFNTTKASVLKFTTVTYRKAGSRIELEYNKGTTSDVDVQAVSEAPVLTYGARYEQKHEIRIPKLSPKPTTDLEITVRVINKSDESLREIYKVKATALYPGTTHPPVRVGGLLWAPVNVGAKNADGNSTSEDDAGRIYQWGRNNDGWVYNGTATPALPNSGYAKTIDVAMNEENYGKFINLSQAEPYHWLTPADFTLWSGVKSQGPCPDGWRIPTNTEFQKLADAAKAVGRTTVSDRRFIVKGDEDGKTLNLVFSGYKGWNFGDSPNTYYYHSSVASGNRLYVFVATKGSATGFSVSVSVTAACGTNIRCVAVE